MDKISENQELNLQETMVGDDNQQQPYFLASTEPVNQPVPIPEDLHLTRMYFSSLAEIFGRLFILISQGLMMGVIIIVSASLAMIATTQLPIPAAFNQFGVADGVFRGMTVVIALGGVIFSLVFVIPILIVRNIRLVKLTGILLNSLGFLFGLVMLGLSIISYLYIPVRLNFPGVILAALCCLLIFMGSVLLWSAAIHKKSKLRKAIVASEQFKAVINPEQ
ncbi:hypothetical protein P344_02005 [Spiroplasma mirum ATCC 29335]|uniref:Transmembrane protein n=1 Tax=Spiroplasma mirum ATCC 29335 TaxID=838561 RepID=W0GKT3_9MOLU|nr:MULTISPECIES: hypothetical protein [Spiroplasma]AHF60787.1 putative transmembrane protein [Spiroplasma mirum ATCC 29335]AHI57749.1 hypothetical protein P344_02005 [Spiroplasma mirum ATCC 29335]AKM52901.1 hypothetical protein SATRI_v1c03800 [Spiroplasma atrichopogonis]